MVSWGPLLVVANSILKSHSNDSWLCESRSVGDFRNSFFDLGWDAFTPEEQERKRAIELNQGRAAMMGILALMVHEQLPSHDPYIINSLIGYPVDFNAGF